MPPTKKVKSDVFIGIKTLAFPQKMSSGSASSILRNRLGYRTVCARWVPHILTPQQKWDRVACSSALLEMCENCYPRHLGELVTGDETWLYYFEPMRKAMNKAWVPKRGDMPQLARRCCSEQKVPYTLFLLLKRHCATETTQDKSITGEYYRDCSFGNEQILQKCSTSLRNTWNQASLR